MRRTAIALLAALAVVTAAGAQGPRVPRLRHVVVVVFENEERGAVLGSGNAPTFDALAARYAQATDYRAVAHPSLPNYLALVSGSTHGVTEDCTDCPQTGATIGSRLTAAHRTWATYAEGYPLSPLFAKRHVPFLYFPGGDEHVHGLARFVPTKLPAFALVVPDFCHDMHDCPVSTGDRWLARFVKPLLTQNGTIVFIVFDEGSSNLGGGGQVVLIAAGAPVQPHTRYDAPATHYGLLRTISDALGVAPVGAARNAKSLTGIWR